MCDIMCDILHILYTFKVSQGGTLLMMTFYPMFERILSLYITDKYNAIITYPIIFAQTSNYLTKFS